MKADGSCRNKKTVRKTPQCAERRRRLTLGEKFREILRPERVGVAIVCVGCVKMEKGDPEDGNPLHAIKPRQSCSCREGFHGIGHASLLFGNVRRSSFAEFRTPLFSTPRYFQLRTPNRLRPGTD